MLLEHTEDIVFHQDARGLFTYVSPVVEHITGYSTEDWCTNRVVRLTDNPINREAVRVTEQMLRTGRETALYQAEIFHRDGRRVRLELKKRPYHREGRVAGIVGVARDVTERVRAEEALRESEERFRQLAENVRQVFWMATGDLGKIIYVNPAYESIWGRSCQALYENAKDWLEAIHSDDRERVAQRYFAEAWETFEEEYRIVRPDGSVRWIRDRAFPVRDSEGRVCRIAGIADDVTERKEVERALRESKERYDLAVRASTAGIWEAQFEPDGAGAWQPTVAYFSQRLADLLGYGIDELAFGVGQLDRTRAWLHVHPEDRERVRDSLYNHLRDGTPFDDEYRVQTRREGWRWFRGSGQAVWDEAGNPVRMAGSLVDVTARKLAEERERQHAAEVTRVSRLNLANQMAAAWAHEINQPLGAIVSYARGCALRLRQGTGEPEALAETVEEIAAEALRASEVIRRLRTLLEKGEGRRDAVDLDALVRRVAHLMDPLVRQHRVAIGLRLAVSTPPVQADTIAIEQVILNLLQNGLDSIPVDGTGQKELLIETAVRGGREVEVTVSDTGAGLPPAAIDNGRVFDPFFTTKPRGLGLGLAICRSIVETHGGRLSVEARPSGGTSFRFTLPLQREEDSDDEIRSDSFRRR